MPPLPSPLFNGSLGVLVPPKPPSAGGATRGSTRGPTFGTTEWTMRWCAAAEAAGASGIWLSDHLLWRTPTLEPFTSLPLAAAATKRAAVGTCVLQLPLRSTAAVAKQSAAIQLQSGGRFVLGVGVGSHRGEYDRAGEQFATRGRRLDDAIEAMRTLWALDPSAAYRMEPPTHVPVWVGGSSQAARRRAAALGDGWVPLFVAPDAFGDGLDEVRSNACAAGRDPGALHGAVVMVAAVGESVPAATRSASEWLAHLYGIPPKAFERHVVAGPPERCAEAAAHYVEAGADHVVVMVADDDALGHFGQIAEAHDAARGPATALAGAAPAGAALAGAGLAGAGLSGAGL